MILKLAKISAVHFFLVIALIFGSLFAIFVPPFQAPDESSHLFRSVHLSTGKLMGEKKDQRLGGEIDQAYLKYYKEYAHLRFSDAKMSKDSNELISKTHTVSHKIVFTDFPNTAYFSPIVYAPHLASLLFSSLSDQVSFRLYLMRLFNLMVWVGLIFICLKIIPSHKWVLCCLALLPSSLFLHASANADAMTNGLSFLMIAIIWALNSKMNDKRKRKYLLMLPAIMLILLSSKIIYALLFYLIIFVNKNHFPKGIKKSIYLSGNSLLFILFFFFWYGVVDDLFISYDAYNPLYRESLQINPGVNPDQQLAFVLKNPLQFLGVLFDSYWDSAAATIAHYVGKFGWGKNYLPAWLIGLHLLFIIAISFLDRPKTLLKKWKMIYISALGFGLMVIFALLMYMQWNEVESAVITNLSGRYFIPIFPLFFLVLASVKRSFDESKAVFQKVLLLYLMYIPFCLLISSFQIYSRFWL